MIAREIAGTSMSNTHTSFWSAFIGISKVGMGNILILLYIASKNTCFSGLK